MDDTADGGHRVIPDLWRLDGRVAVVTGGSRGLGRVMAETFSAAGATVVVASRSLDSCEAAANEITAVTGNDVLPLAFHAGHWDAAESLTEQVWDCLGRLDVLVNNAGMSPTYPAVDEASEQLFDKVIAVNLKGPFRLTALVGTRMAAADGGSIINVSSMASLKPRPDVLPYAAAKAGLNALTLGFARAFGPTVRCNAIVAGTFMTDVSNADDGTEPLALSVSPYI